MNLNKLSILCLLALLLLVFSQCKQGGEKSIDVSSPDSKIKVTFMLTEGVPYYQVSRSDKEVIKASKLGFTFKNAAPLNQNLTNVRSQKSSFDETWIQPWAQERNMARRLKTPNGISTLRQSTVFQVYLLKAGT